MLSSWNFWMKTRIFHIFQYKDVVSQSVRSYLWSDLSVFSWSTFSFTICLSRTCSMSGEENTPKTWIGITLLVLWLDSWFVVNIIHLYNEPIVLIVGLQIFDDQDNYENNFRFINSVIKWCAPWLSASQLLTKYTPLNHCFFVEG